MPASLGCIHRFVEGRLGLEKTSCRGPPGHSAAEEYQAFKQGHPVARSTTCTKQKRRNAAVSLRLRVSFDISGKDEPIDETINKIDGNMMRVRSTPSSAPIQQSIGTIGLRKSSVPYASTHGLYVPRHVRSARSIHQWRAGY